MRKLHRDRHARMLAHAFEHVRQRLFCVVRPQAEVVWRDAAFGLDRGRFQEQNAGTGQSEVAEVDQVPIGRRAILRRVLAHRRDGDAVLQFERAEGNRSKQCIHDAGGSWTRLI